MPRLRAYRATSLAVIHPPDLVVDAVGGEERRQLLLVVPAVGVKHRSDRARASSLVSETDDVAGEIPVDRTAESVLEIVPDQAARGAEQVGQRYVPVQRLGGNPRFEHVLSQLSQPRREPRDSVDLSV